MDIEIIKNEIIVLASKYPIKKALLFGSRAAGTNRADSDVDLIIEFGAPVSILKISQLRCDLEDALGLSVDVIHGPMRDTDMIEIGKTVELYAA